ncbi:MAG: hypothetical protein E7773_10675 [Sphingomonas sp.]|uniref:hypothetical protein n=1 Tax=Sphingomonas sp. TaxID=28214 RepID=UPI00120455FC|nr:hypothetical protein [Sphingomonas sp.]THD35570.1 MAG: hypothetical protein E7773_10675 [Sphingomonas sp.]
MTDNDTADRLMDKRARMMPALAAMFVAQQAVYFTGPRLDEGKLRLVNYISIGGWLALSTVLLFGLVTGGTLFRSASVRALMNDEGTRANRADALSWGFVATMIGAIALYVLSLFERMTERETIHVVMTIGIAAALLRFGILERRALKNG